MSWCPLTGQEQGVTSPKLQMHFEKYSKQTALSTLLFAAARTTRSCQDHTGGEPLHPPSPP